MQRDISETTSLVLVVGNCEPDHAAIRRLLMDNFAVEVEGAATVEDALDRMRRVDYRLALVNRLCDADGGEGIELLRLAKADDALPDAAVMMISNDRDAQDAAEAAGGLRGFGKADLFAPATVELLARYLPRE